MSYLVVDVEGTDKYPETAEVLSVCIINSAREVLLNTLVRPVRHGQWPAAQRIHGITPAQVLRDEVPTLADLTPQIADIVRGQVVVAYSAVYDAGMLREAFALGPPAEVKCAMLAFAEHPEVRYWNDHYGNWHWHSLDHAAYRVGHEWQGKAHTALADCFAARDVWAWVTDPAERAQLDAAKEERALQQRVDDYLAMKWRFDAEAADKASRARNEAWELVHYPAMGVREFRRPIDLSAEASADAFSRHLTGYPVRVWNGHGRTLKLKRYTSQTIKERPKYLITKDMVYFLRPTWEYQYTYELPFPEDKAKKPACIEPAAMWQKDDTFPNSKYSNQLTPLFDLRKLELGVDYVPYIEDYQAGYCSRTALVRDHKLKPKLADQVRPAFMLLRKKYDDYLLYPIPQHEPVLTT